MTITFQQLKEWIKAQEGKDSKTFKGQPWHESFWTCLNGTQDFCNHYLKFPHGFAETDNMESAEEALEHLIEFNINFYLEKPKQVLTAELKRQQDRGPRNSSQLGRHTARLWYILEKQKVYSFV